MNDTLAQNIYKSVQEDNEVRNFECWHASSIAECPRSHYFKRLGIRGDNYVGAGKMLRWQAGHMMEAVLRPHLEKIFPDLLCNVRMTSELLDLTGEYDNYSEAEQTIYEVKSVHDFAFQYKKKADTRFHLKDAKPYLNHQLQNHCYVKLLEEGGKPVKYIVYIYVTLDGRIATYKTDVNPDYLANVTKRLEILNKAWQTKTPPECICREGHPLWASTMQYCDYRKADECCSLELLATKENE